MAELSAEQSSPAAPSGLWFSLNAFFKTSIGGAVLTLLCTTLLGAIIGNHFSSQARREAAHTEQAKTSEAGRHTLNELFANTIVARRTAVGLMKSGIELDAPKAELEARWAAYQQAYAGYNTNLFGFLSDMLSYLGAGKYELFRVPMEGSISRSFERIDRCLTQSYRLYQRFGRNMARARLTSCTTKQGASFDMSREVEKLDGCFGTVRTELMYAIYLEDKFDHLPEADRDPSSTWLSKLGSAVGNRAGATCSSGNHWVCDREQFGKGLKAKLNVAVCKDLRDSNYVVSPEPSPVPAPAVGMPGQVTHS